MLVGVPGGYDSGVKTERINALGRGPLDDRTVRWQLIIYATAITHQVAIRAVRHEDIAVWMWRSTL